MIARRSVSWPGEITYYFAYCPAETTLDVEYAGHRTPDGLQRLLNRATWNAAGRLDPGAAADERQRRKAHGDEPAAAVPWVVLRRPAGRRADGLAMALSPDELDGSSAREAVRCPSCQDCRRASRSAVWRRFGWNGSALAPAPTPGVAVQARNLFATWVSCSLPGLTSM